MKEFLRKLNLVNFEIETSFKIMEEILNGINGGKNANI